MPVAPGPPLHDHSHGSMKRLGAVMPGTLSALNETPWRRFSSALILRNLTRCGRA
jgi:hypothetical protein